MKPNIKEKIERLLKSANLRQTGPRVAVLSVLVRAKRPVTQDEIATSLTPNAPNKVTIYRILESFVKAGFVHKAYLEARTWHFELADHCSEEQCHPHFVCNSCGHTRCLPEASSPAVKVAVERICSSSPADKTGGFVPVMQHKEAKNIVENKSSRLDLAKRGEDTVND